ncbi:MAG: iron-sulfur cluster assembly scaffold protein [Candidatus Babeliales bacterium]
MNIYQELLRDHYRFPRNQGKLTFPDFVSKQFNPSCGDTIQFSGYIKNKMIKKLAFEGKGCVISQATASLLTEEAKEKTFDEVMALDKDFIQHMIGMQLGPIRVKCALLPLLALQEGIVTYNKKADKKS